MAKIPGIARRLALVRLVLLWEAVWPSLWPMLGVVGAFTALALFDVLPLLPGWLHALVLAFGVVAFVWAAARAVRHLRLPRHGAAERRLEQDSGIPHRPLSTLADHPVGTGGDPGTTALWQIHLARALATVQKLRVRLPRPGLAGRDPLALRLAVAIALIVGFAMAAGDAERRLVRAVTPDIHGLAAARAATLELWVTPPDYTDLPPRLLASADDSAVEAETAGAPVVVPVGSRLLAQVNHGNGTPQLVVGERSEELAPAGDKAWRLEVPLDEAGSHLVRVTQAGTTLGDWQFDVAADAAPVITFGEPPQGSRRNALHIAYRTQDDYGVVGVHAEIFGPDGLAGTNQQSFTIELPPPIGDPRDGAGSSFHDLTAHPWAGLEVGIQLVAVDGPGQQGRSDRLSITLPERTFNHPVARRIIAQRRALALAPDERRHVAGALHRIAVATEQYGDDIAVFLALMSARSRLIHNVQPDSIDSVQTLLWQTALRVEDGALSLAERDLRAIQQRLQEALARNADDAEISRLLDELRDALDRFFEALAENLRQQLQDLDVSSLPRAPADLETIDRQSLEQMLNRLEQLARSGDRDAAQQLLSQLQQMLENLQNQPLALQQQGDSSQAQEMMRELQDIVRQQQELYDRTFRRSQQGQGSPEQSAADAAAQNALRRQLGELMRLLGERAGRIPQNLGNAERAMREAEGALGSGQLEGALDPQARALEELREGARSMAAQLFRQPGPGQGEGPQQGYMPYPQEDERDPLGRLLPRDSSQGTDSGSRVRIPEPGGAERALRIQQQLRDRLRDTGRPEDELHYLERLLRRF